MEKVCYVTLIGELQVERVNLLMQECAKKAKDFDTVYLAVESPGGANLFGLNAYEILRSLPIKLITHAVNSVDSAAGILFLAGEERYATKTCSFNVHPPFMPMEAGRYDEQTLREKAENLKADKNKLVDIYSERTLLKKERFIRFLNKKTVFSAEQAKSYGIVHNIRELPKLNRDDKVVFIGRGLNQSA